MKTGFNVVMATFTLKWNYKQSGVRVRGGRNLKELSVTVKQNIVVKKRPPLIPPWEIGEASCLLGTLVKTGFNVVKATFNLK